MSSISTRFKIIGRLIASIRKKPVWAITLAAAVLLAAFGIAALAGVSGRGGRTAAGNEESIASQATAEGTQENASSGSAFSESLLSKGMLDFMGTTVTIEPGNSDSLGVDPATRFLLSFGKAPDEAAFTEALKIEPSHPFKLEKLSPTEYGLEFDGPLQGDSIYNIILADNSTGARQSWAFQTKKQFNVVRTLPRDKSAQVPANTGIEITFTHENIENAESFFGITPYVKGRFEWHKKTLVFVPEKLEEGAVYTVAVKKGIKVKGSNETLPSDYIFSFQTAFPEDIDIKKRTYFSFSAPIYTFSPQAAPALQVYGDDALSSREVGAEIYSYPDAGKFLEDLKVHDPAANPSWYLRKSGNAAYDTENLQKVASVSARIAPYQRLYWQENYLVLPSPLSEGYYLLAVDIDGDKYYAQVQVNTAAAYIVKAKNKTLAWLNNSETGKPLAGAGFALDGGKSAKAGADGVAVLDVPLDPETGKYFLVKPDGGIPLIARVVNDSGVFYGGYYWNYNSDITDNYWTYLYLDRDKYLPEDTVNIWGILKPRDGRGGGSDAILELVRYSYSDRDAEFSVLSSQNAKIRPSGTFDGKLEISGFNPGSYEVRVRVGDKIMITRYIEIIDYTKPAYKIEITGSRNYMYAWETVDFDIFASFFEGTPVSGAKLDYTCSISGAEERHGVLVSDQQGMSSLSLKPSTGEEGWRPVGFYLEAGNYEAEEQPIRGSGYVAVFPKDTMIETQSKIEGGTGTLDFLTSRIDLSELEGREGGYYAEDDYRGAPVDMPLKVKLYERHYEKKKTGEFYDFINKVRRDVYEYETVSKLVGAYAFTTVNGRCRLEFETEKQKNYHAEIEGRDSGGRRIKETVYIYNWDYISPYDMKSYCIVGDGGYHAYKSGERAAVEVKYNGDRPVDGSNRRYMYIRMKNGICGYEISSDSTYGFTFEDRFMPNMYVKAVCFDGKNIYDAGMKQFNYDSSEKKLDIVIKPGKESYRPGETATLSVEVKDRDGKPCGAEVCISVVDEAFFAISPQYVNTLSSLYGPTVSPGIIAEYISYTPPGENTIRPMAEKGEGGDVYSRKDFKDTALFATVAAGADGKATASFKLPDNLTSWRVTCQAATDDLKAGSAKINISTKLPFFIDTIFNKSFITGDSPSVLLRAYGSGVGAGARVDFKVTVSGKDGTARQYSASGTASIIKEIALGSFKAGEYTIRAEGSSGGLKDAIERSFKVYESLLETSHTDYISLSDNTIIPAKTKGLTTLVFFGEDSAMLYRELRSLYWSGGSRLDQKLARKLAGRLLQEYFGETPYYEEEIDIRRHQTDDGGLALLTYDSSDPALSAKLCSLAAEDIDRGALASYFYRQLDNPSISQEDAAYCYWGLAALKEPVLLEIRPILEKGGLTPETRLILGAALAEIGDFRGAAEIYLDMMKNAGKTTENLAWVERETRDESIGATSLCALIALKINAPEKIKLFNYIKSNSTSELLVNMERMIFATNYARSLNMETGLKSSFSYKLDGAEKKVELEKGKWCRMDLTPQKLSSLKFSDVAGKVAVAASYVAPAADARPEGGNVISLERTYTLPGSMTPVSSFSRSDTVKVALAVSLGENAPDGYYEITDVMPSGFRFLRADYSPNAGWHFDKNDGQKVVFGLYYNKARGTSFSMTYYAKAAIPGTYTADNAAASHVSDGGITAYAGRTTVTVNK